MSDEAGSGLALAPDEGCDLCDQVVVGEPGGDVDLHGYSIPQRQTRIGQIHRLVFQIIY